jgi:beta-lactamase regulating signal transducer with metallopeptidase domain
MDVVLNWLTQGAVVAMTAAAGLRVIPLSRAQARYGVVWTAYLLVLALPAAPPVLSTVLDGPTGALVPAAAGPVVTMPETWWTSSAVAIGLWIVWSAVQTVRLVAGALGVRDARRRGCACPADVLARLPHWSRVSASGRRTRVTLSTQVRAAAVLGCGTPTIALAPALIEQLGAADLDRVLVHEWAHVQRRDDLAQLAERLIRIVVGWHPAAWWLERQIEFEREAACDEIVVRVTGSAKGYAACLAALAVLPDPPLRSVPVLAAASPSRLYGRVVRILAAPCVAVSRPWRAIAVCAGGGLLACAVVVANLHVVAFAVTSAVASAAASPLAARPIVRDVLLAWRSAERANPGPSSVAAGRHGLPANPSPATHEASPASAWAVEPSASVPAVTDASELPVLSSLPVHFAVETPAPALTAATEPRPAEQARGVWTRAADVGVGIGRASQRAGTATAGFFSRFGRKVAGSL